MKLGSLAASRAAYYDRNATSQLIQYVAQVTPHVDTLRATYTTPAGKKAYVEAATVYIRCETAPTVAGRNIGLVRVTDTLSNLIDIARIDKLANATQNASYSVTSTTMPTIYAGETMTLRTTDTSTGGLVDYVLGAKVTQFDA